MKHIRNFCIIAHIDHGKSTLADRLLQITKTVAERDLKDQLLDDMDLERERGITIKSHAIQMKYSQGGQDYILNLIDTPGHVDFSYEVSRSIAACEGALLLVDASQGIEAQTISNLYLAIGSDLEIIPVVNKVDLPSGTPEEAKDEIVELIGCDRDSIIEASGKTGVGIDEILEAIIERIPPPTGSEDKPLQALIFDSLFNQYRGVVAYCRVLNGGLRKGDKIKFMATGMEYIAEEVGILKLEMIPKKELKAGDVGYLITGIKDSKDLKVGDTLTTVGSDAEAVEGFEDVKPMVFAGIFPVDTEDFEALRDSLAKLALNDAALTYEAETSTALGFGFRCGFLGLLHMEIIQERLQREFDMTVLTTVPNVSYHAYTTKGNEIVVNNPSDYPDPTQLDHVEEPFIDAIIISKPEFIGAIMKLCIEKRGSFKNQVYLTETRVELSFDLPLAEIVFDFYDKLKSVSRGYASFDYHISDYRTSELVRLDILFNGDPVDALSALIHRDKAEAFGRKICSKLKELVPRQQFMIAIQAAIGAKIIARESLSALRKDVTAKCYGGDITRKRKLLEKQKKGKKKMRKIGNVEIPQKAFLAVLKIDD